MDLRPYFERHFDIRPGQPGPWVKARCPLSSRHKHKDRNPSLGCNVETGGLKCHGCGLAGDIFKLWQSLGLPQSPSGLNGAGSDPAGYLKKYTYRTAGRSVAYEVFRMPDKQFPVKSPKGYGLKGVERVPYRLPEMVAVTDTDIFCCEGEKDADTVAAMGFTATATVGGSSRTDFSKEALYFKGRHCIILPDADKPGRTYADNLAAALAPYARSVKILQLPDLEPDSGQDVTDWAGKFDTLTDAGEELSRLADQAVEIGLQESPEPEVLEAVKPLPYFSVQKIAALEIPPQKWIVRDLIPAGEIGICYGDAKAGKSLLLYCMGLHIERREPWLQMFETEHVRTLFLAREDPARRIQKRQEEMLSGYGFTEQEKETFFFVMREPFDLMEERDFASLLQTIEETGAELVILDVLGKMIGGVEENSAKDFARVVKALEVLRDFRPEPLTILCVDHTRKTPPGSSGDTEISPHDLKGTALKRGAADFLISFSETKREGQFRIIAENKDTDPCPDFLINRSPLGSPGPKHTYAGDVEEFATESRSQGDKNKKRVLEALKEKQLQSSGEIAEDLEMSNATARVHLSKLEEEGKAERVGKGKGTKWRLVIADLPLQRVSDKPRRL